VRNSWPLKKPRNWPLWDVPKYLGNTVDMWKNQVEEEKRVKDRWKSTLKSINGSSETQMKNESLFLTVDATFYETRKG
jgi:hypothetical protein